MMNRGLFFIIAALTVLFRYETAEASQTTRKGVSCSVKLSDLSYVGMKFTGSTECVDAFNDVEAVKACKGRLVINPGNPQYGKVGVGTLNTNTLGYYYCVTPENRKDRLCLIEAKKKFTNLFFRWEKVTKTDGNCYCGSNENNTNSFHECSQSVEAVAAAVQDECEKINLRKDNRSKATLSSAEKSSVQCQCANSENYYPLAEAKEKCSQTAAAPPPAAVQTAVVSGTKENVEKAVDKALEDCVNEWVSFSDKCKTKGSEAKKACTYARKENEDSNVAADLMSATGDIMMVGKANTNTQAECFAGGVMSMGFREGIKATQVSCESEYEACKESCSNDKYDEFLKTCSKKAKLTADDLMNQDNANGQFFKAQAEIIKTNFEDGTKLCRIDARQKQSTLSSLLDGVGKALSDSMRCACKLASAPGADCNAIPSINACEQVPQPPFCDIYGSGGICVPGSSAYDARACSCATNPGGRDCSGQFGGGNSTFGGPAPALTTGAVPVGSMGGGSYKGSNFNDLSGGTVNDSTRAVFSNNTKSVAPGSSPGGGTGGGAGAAAGGGAPPEDESAKAAVAAEKPGPLGDMFNQAKNFMTNSLGLTNGKKPSETSNKGNGPMTPDMTKFKPGLRGLATQQPGKGGKNMDIWKMMFLCSDGVTCKSNEDNYIIGP